jgi:predicted DNA-binding antitoxin AbrB/MazE fold protein
MTPLVIEATYENGVLKPAEALPLEEHQRVQITINSPGSRVRDTAGLIPCGDAKLIEHIALDPIEDL